ncbi:hypothetical protein AVEN_227465-1 [Araneus ventricosus]|uniref:DUF4817 domain-containing protein n=1 Tax=Araneus ventricosus TaxID=182803 RepID=A0A4Y2C3A6_ARAVE|nr:hypothetical protein AVEN_227465-1 [Araneus ventricosus]
MLLKLFLMMAEDYGDVAMNDEEWRSFQRIKFIAGENDFGGFIISKISLTFISWILSNTLHPNIATFKIKSRCSTAEVPNLRYSYFNDWCKTVMYKLIHASETHQDFKFYGNSKGATSCPEGLLGNLNYYRHEINMGTKGGVLMAITSPTLPVRIRSNSKSFFQSCKALIGRTKSAAAGDPQSKYQNGYHAVEGTSLIPRSIITVRRRFRIEYRNCQSSSKNCIKGWYEQFKGRGNVLHRKGAGLPSVSDEDVQRERETFIP